MCAGRLTPFSLRRKAISAISGTSRPHVCSRSRSAKIRSGSSAAFGASDELKDWTLRKDGDKTSYKVTVPCTVAGALNEAGVFGENVLDEDRYSKLDKTPFDSPWIYTTSFKTRKGLRHVLRFDGLNYYADVELNGKLIASADTTFGTFSVRERAVEVGRHIKEADAPVVEGHPWLRGRWVGRGRDGVARADDARCDDDVIGAKAELQARGRAIAGDGIDGRERGDGACDGKQQRCHCDKCAMCRATHAPHPLELLELATFMVTLSLA